MLFRHHDADRPFVGKDDLAVANLVLLPAEGMDAVCRAVNAQRRLLRHFDLGENAAGRRIPAIKRDARRLADQAAASIAPDEIARPQPHAIEELDGDAGIVLHETRHLSAAVDRHPEFADPPGEDAFDVFLPQRQPVIVPGREIADIQPHRRKSRDLGDLAFGEEAVDDPALIQNLQRARAQATGTRPGELLVWTALDDRDVDTRQRQLACQRQPRRPCSGNHDCMSRHA